MCCHVVMRVGFAQNCCLEDESGPNYPNRKSSVLKMKSEAMTGKDKRNGNCMADCNRNVHESKIQEGDKVLLRQEKENKLSMPYKECPFTVVQKNGKNVLVEADTVQYCRNVKSSVLA